MNLPLYRSIREQYPENPSFPNAALIFARFVEWGDGWQASGEHKRKVFEKIADYQADANLLTAFLERQKQQVDALGGVILEAETLGRFVSGLGDAHPFETGFTWHRTLGVPYLPGSGVKGAVRAWAEQWSDEEDAARLFGGPSQQGPLVVLDALPVKPPGLETDVMTPHYGEYYGKGEPPGDYLSPMPVAFLTVAAGSIFRFSLIPVGESGEDLVERGAGLLKEALETIGAGAKTSAGYGTFAVKEPKKDLRFQQMGERIAAMKPDAIGSVPALVDDLANLPAGQERKELARLIHGRFLAGKKNSKRRDKPWFQNLQRMREEG
ncbi:MAG: type III-B CRISPR module RAMP protein Cmr6 [Actinobacteria bacterium]|nr:type III-B CRISPR module RAMP protein Cmr6 [Actinomycetota bacterium]